MFIRRARSLSGAVELPGDKSISHRAALLASIADGKCRIENFAESADCSSTLECAARLGVRVSRNKSSVEIEGKGKYGLLAPGLALDCGNSGTTMRLLSGILAGQPFDSTLVGDPSLSKRPMRRIIEPLSDMGAELRATDGHAPIIVKGKKPLKPIEFVLPVPSAQLKSCVLLAGLYADGKTSVVEPTTTRDHTERMLGAFGVDVVTTETPQGRVISVAGDTVLKAADIVVPADISSSAFFLVAAACLKGSTLEIPNVGLNPTRTAVIEVLKRFGADIQTRSERAFGGEPVGTLVVKYGGVLSCRDHVINGEIVANLIDEVPILAVFGTQVEGGIEIRDAGELRVKESDRIAALVENLGRMGAKVEEFKDGIRVERSNLRGAVIDPFGDHRIAMAFAIAGLFAEGETEILNSECVAVSFPRFFDVLSSVTDE